MHIRWLLRRDLPRVVEIERLSFPSPWDEAQFRTYLKQRNTIMRVACEDVEPMGYVAYERYKDKALISSIAVDPLARRHGIGRKLMESVRRCCGKGRIQTYVWERNLGAQQFLRACGFTARGLIQAPYDCNEDAAVQFQLDEMPSGGEVWDRILSEVSP